MFILKYSYYDIFLIILAILQFTIQFTWGFYFNQLSLLENIALGSLLGYLYFFNLISITHSFIHTPFFKSKLLNQIFYFFNSLNLLFPITYYNESHLVHHKYPNDPKKNGTCNDPTSTYLFGKNGNQENVIKYCGLAFFRDWTIESLTEVSRKKYFKRFLIEMLGISFLVAFLIYINYSWFLFVFIPIFYVAWFFINMQNYYEHYTATNPYNKYADSTSYYGKLYNLIMFNEGYHQEHHIRPNTHWTQRPEMRHKFRKELQANKAKELSVPIVFAFLDTKKNKL